MTVAAASLQNLTPYPSTWGLPTQPIRVPVQFLGKVKEMVQNLVQQLHIHEGKTAPAGQTEQEWANEMLGLPANYQLGDPLPPEIAKEVEQIKQDNAQIEALSGLSEAKPTITPEPTRGTQAWINWQKETCGDRWDFPTYLKMLRQEAAEGDESAKAELMVFRAGGLDRLDTDDLNTPQSRKQAKLARRAANAKGAGAKVLDLGAIEKLTTGRTKKREERAQRQEAMKYHNHLVEQDKLALKLGKHSDLFFEHIHQAQIAMQAFLDRIKATCAPGKVDQYIDFLNREDLKWFSNGDEQEVLINSFGYEGYLTHAHIAEQQLIMSDFWHWNGTEDDDPVRCAWVENHNDTIFVGLATNLIYAWDKISKNNFDFLIGIPDKVTQHKLRLHGVLPK